MALVNLWACPEVLIFFIKIWFFRLKEVLIVSLKGYHSGL
jgi:hypothetical protein